MRRVVLSFASRLIFYILTLTTLIFLCIAIVFHRYSRLREERQAVGYTSLLQERLIQRIDFELEEVENSVRSEVYRVKRVKDNPDEIMPIVKNLVKGDSLIMGGSIAFVRNYYEEKGERFMEYAYLEEQGGKKRLLTKHLGDSNYHYLSMPWFADALAQRKGVWSEPYFDKGGGNRMMTTFSYPVCDEEGKAFAVITADVSLEDLSLNIFTIRPYPDSYSFIVSRKGTYLSHPDKRIILKSSIFSRARELGNDDLVAYGHKMLAGEKGTFRSKVDGKEVLACYAPLPRTGWTICSICPYGTVMAQLGSTFGIMALILLGGLLLLSLCIRLLVKYTVKPIQQFTEATTLQQERMQSELTIAHDIQMDIVPKVFSPFPVCENLELYALLKPAKEVGGDLYDFFIRDEKLFFCIGDVSGKGIPASLVMAITSTLFRMTANSFDSPSMIVTKLNETISHNNEANMFVTMFVGVLDLQSGVLTYCNAGHNPPILASENEESRFLQVKVNLPIGVMGGVEYENKQVALHGNQTLLVYTDGLTEAENGTHELFGEQRTLDVAARYATCSVKDMITNIQDDLVEFVAGAEQSDDLTMLAVRLKDLTVRRDLAICNELAESAKLAPFVEAVGEDVHLPQNMVMSLNLALEEALVNVIQYAYPTHAKGQIVLEASWKSSNPSTLTFVLTDEGVAFNPLQVEKVDVTQGLDERPIGGLGIFLIRKLMDEVTYRREENKNKLVMVKHIR